MSENHDVDAHLERLETLIHQTEKMPDEAVRAHVQEIVENLLDFHAAAVARMIDRALEQKEAGRAILTAWPLN